MRDNEWQVFNGIWQAEKEQKGIPIGGIRRAGKSVFEASYIGHGATFDQDSQNIIAGINAADIKLITDKIDKGLNNLPDYFKWQRIEENWTKAVSFGIRAKDNSKFVFSQILIRNLDDGNNEEAIAGTKPRKLIIDESLWEEELVHLKDKSIPIRDVNVGDEIYDDQGQLTEVLEKINPGIVPCYRFTLGDKHIVSSLNHIWKVIRISSNTEEELTTHEIISEGFDKFKIPIRDRSQMVS